MTQEELFEKITEWLFKNTAEYEFEYRSGIQETGIKFYNFKSKDDMIDDLRKFFNMN